MKRFTFFVVAASFGWSWGAATDASTVVFFNSSQIASPIATGETWDTISSNGYLFTYTRDKLFTGGGSVPIGRYVRIPWPQGVEAQAVTSGPNPGKAKITIERVDGDVFDLTAFTAQLLANTAATGANFEIVPFLNGEEVFDDPFYFDASGYYGSTFSYDETPDPWGRYSTAPLKGYDAYDIKLFVDFAWTGLTLEGAAIQPPPGDYNQDYVVNAADYVVWRKMDGTQAGYDTWQAHFGEFLARSRTLNETTIGPAAIPEPVGTTLAVIGGALATILRCSKTAIF